MSSLLATRLREKAPPGQSMNVPSNVSTELPLVSIVATPSKSGVQLYQSDAPPRSPALSGSPGSVVAPLLSVVSDPPEAVSTIAFAMLTLGGAAPPGPAPARPTTSTISPTLNSCARPHLNPRPLNSTLEHVTCGIPGHSRQ